MRLGVLVVFDEDAGRAIENLARLGDAQLDAGRRHTHRVGPHLVVGLLRDEDRRFGLAVELLEVDPERAPEIEDLRPDGLARRIGHAHVRHARAIADRPVNQDIVQPVEPAVPPRHGLSVEDRRSHPAGVRHGVVVDAALQRRGVLHPDRDGGDALLEVPGRREEIGRPDLVQVLVHRGRALGAVHAETAPHGLPEGEDEVADPGHRQVGQHAFVLGQPVEFSRSARGLDDVAVRQDDALRPARGPAGIEHDAGVFGSGRVAPPFQLGDQLGAPRAARGLHLGERLQMRMSVFSEAPRIEVDDVPQVRQPVLDLDGLVDLLLVLHHRHPRAAVVKDIGHLLGHAVLVDRDGNAARHLRRHHRPVEAGPVAPRDGDMIALLEAKRQKSKRQRLDLVRDLGPGPALPDAQLFFPIRRTAAVTPDIAREKPRNGSRLIRQMRVCQCCPPCRPRCARGSVSRRMAGRSPLRQ